MSGADVSPFADECWEASEEDACAVVVAGSHRLVAIIGDPMSEPTPADLRRFPLVVAAPAMLRALKGVDALLSRDGQETPGTMRLAYPPRTIAAWEAVRAAIAGAERVA